MEKYVESYNKNMFLIMPLSAFSHLTSPRRLLDAVALGKITTEILMDWSV